jgi:hypothetical protein
MQIKYSSFFFDIVVLNVILNSIYWPFKILLKIVNHFSWDVFRNDAKDHLFLYIYIYINTKNHIIEEDWPQSYNDNNNIVDCDFIIVGYAYLLST